MVTRVVLALGLLVLASPATAAAAGNGPIAFESRLNVAVVNLNGSGRAVVSQGESDEETGDEGVGLPRNRVANRFPAPMPSGRQVAYVHDATDHRHESSQIIPHSSTICIKRLGLAPKRVLEVGRRVFSSTATIQDLAVSPDGKRIVFAMEDGDDLDLFTVRARGGGLRRLTDTNTDEITPTWAPGGKTIAFARVAHPHPREPGYVTADIFTIAARDGSHQRRLTHGAAFNAHPSYSPDGRRVAFERRPHYTDNRADPTKIWLMDRDGGAARSLHGTGRRTPYFSPDGRWIAYANYEKYEIEAVRLSDRRDPGGRRRLRPELAPAPTDPDRAKRGPVRGGRCHWPARPAVPTSMALMSSNPKGTQMLNRTIIAGLLSLLTVAAFAVPSAIAAGHGGAVVFSRVTVKTVKEAVTDAEGKPVKDAEGHDEYKEVTTTEGGLYAVKDGHLNQLTEDPSDTEPSFAPDGRAIVYSRGGDIFTVRADGSGLRRLTNGAALDSAPSVSPNGRVVVFERRSAAGTPADLFTVGANGGSARALTSTDDNEHEASFSPDGKAIVFVRSAEESDGGTADDIYSVRPSGTNLARLTRTARVDEFDPRYFAGGIVFSRGESGDEPSAYADIYTMRRNGKKVKSLVAGAGSAYVEDVTPDGHLLLFRRDQGLWVKRIGPGKARKLSELPDGSETNAVFSSDGMQVAAFIEDEGREQLSSISVRSGAGNELAEGFEPTEPGEAGTSSTIGPVITWQPTR